MITHNKTVPPSKLDGPKLRRALMERGFREVKSDGSKLRFQRGSTLRTIITFSPARWRTDVYIDTESGRVRVDVRTTGQLVTDSEREFIDAFADELFAELGMAPGPETTAMTQSSGSSALARRATIKNVKLAVVSTIFSALGTFAFFAFALGNTALAAGAFGLGLLILFVWVATGRKSDERHYD